MDQSTSLQHDGTVQKPKLPPNTLSNVIKWRASLTEQLVPFCNETVRGNVLMAMTLTIARAIRKTNRVDHVLPCLEGDKTHETVQRTIEAFLLGQIVTLQNIRSLVAMIAGNLYELRAEQALSPWTTQPIEEWALAMIEETRHAVTPVRHIPGIDFQFAILTGYAAGQSCDRFLPDGMAKKLARRIGLLGNRERRTPHFREFVRLYCYVHLIAGDKLDIDQYHESASLAARNRAKVKTRADYRELCPEGLQFPCHGCHVGYLKCPQGTHRKDFVLQECSNGHEGHFDPDRRDTVCLECSMQRWRAQH